MDDVILIPVTSSGAAAGRRDESAALVPYAAEQYGESIAESNFARKKLQAHERSLEGLRRDARQQHEIVTQLGSGMKSMVSELDLRRAIGLAFQEFESRLEDVFSDSNRKCLAMFAKREDFVELQGLIGKKVSWTDHNTLLKKLTELRQYVDTMAQSVLVGHRDAMRGEIGKKADSSVVDAALKGKADLTEVNDVRARLERLEVLVESIDKRLVKQVEELTISTSRQNDQQEKRLQRSFEDLSASISDVKDSASNASGRLRHVEGELHSLTETAGKMAEAERGLRTKQEQVLSSLAFLEDHMAQADKASEQRRLDLQSVGTELKELGKTSEQRFEHVSQGIGANQDRLDFLMQASETMKRKAKESLKSYSTKFEEIAVEYEKCNTQIASLERSLKRHERDVRGIENRVSRSEACEGGGPTAALRALMPPAPAELCCLDPPDTGNDRMKGILSQLEKIAAGGHPFETMGVEIDARRPPLPYGGPDKAHKMISSDATNLPRFLDGPSSIDSARGPTLSPAAMAAATAVANAGQTSMRGMHGLSPRPAAERSPGGSKTPRRKK